MTTLAASLAGALLALSLTAPTLRGTRQASAIVYIGSALLCLGLGLAGVLVLAGPLDPTAIRVPIGLPWLGMNLRIDPLSALLLVLLGIGGATASTFAVGYGRHETDPLRTLPFYPGFLGAMALVAMADDAFTFLMSWEVMSLLSWALVLSHHKADETRRASFIYLAMAGFGTMVLLLGFGLMAGAGGEYGFAAIRDAERSAPLTALTLALMLLGTGSKAGLMPVHIWLPVAHPAAPSHVSALMSGVMTKIAIYGFIRVAFDLLGPVGWWMSSLVIVIGAATAVMGTLFAIMDGDAKRVLAWSTIENIGVIFTALGLSLAFRANGMDLLAALAMTAALFHALNHMLFKSLMFMVAGAVLNATGQRRLDALGGLIHKMPRTAVLALIGAIAISALPPLNGFVSEWLLFQSVLQSPALPQQGLQFLVPAAGGMLALTAALAAAAFVRFYGVAFLGRPRSADATRATETDRWSLASMATLAGLCILVGVMPVYLVDLIGPAVALATGSQIAAQSGNAWLTLVPLPEVQSTYSGFLVAVFIAISGGGTAWVVHRLASRKLRRAPAWDCGRPDSDPFTQYGAGSFAQPIRAALPTSSAPGKPSSCRRLATCHRPVTRPRSATLPGR